MARQPKKAINGNSKNELDVFLNRSSKQFGWTPERVREELSRRFGVFTPSNVGSYLSYLTELHDAETNPQPDKHIPYPPCPICGAPTVGGMYAQGKKMTPVGWTCSKNGNKCYVTHRTNKILEKKGVELRFGPVDESMEEVIKEKTLETMTREDHNRIIGKAYHNSSYALPEIEQVYYWMIMRNHKLENNPEEKLIQTIKQVVKELNYD